MLVEFVKALKAIKKEGIQVENRISLTEGNSAVVFTPEFELEANTIYRIKLSAEIRDEFGITLVPFESVFTTSEILGNEAFEPGALSAGMPDTGSLGSSLSS